MPLMTNAIAREALKRGKAEELDEEIKYIRFREGFRKIPRGTVIIGGRVIWGYPHIKRIFTLENGLKRNMPEGELYVEEKIDGFNIRIANVDGKIYAFSRGGFIDPFVTEKARDLHLGSFFSTYPDYLLCAEVVGNTPYTRPTKEFDVMVYVFDIDRGDGDLLGCKERYDILRKFSILGVLLHGVFRSDDFAGLKKLALALNKGMKEGMVLKSTDRKVALKYVTVNSDIEDLQMASETFFDMPIGFYYQRILRSAYFVSDFGLDREDYSQKLGKAFYSGLMRAISKSRMGEDIGEEFEFTIKDIKIWDAIRRHMSREVKIEELSRNEVSDGYRVRFRKVYRKTNRILAAYSSGKGVTD